MSDVILRGTLGVDARRAATKIRDHLLADPATWLCELTRVARASSATALAIELGTSSITVEWDGEPLPLDVIERFGQHLLGEQKSESPQRRGKAQRRDRRPEICTLAVFGAFGDGAAKVEISIARGANEVVSRTLSRREIEGVLTADTRASVETGSRERFSLLPRATGRLALTLPLALGTALRFARVAAEPPAIRALRRRFAGGLAITLDGDALNASSESPLLSFELPAVEGLAVRLDLMSEAPRLGTICFYELGLEIARVSLDPSFGEAPIRVVVSGEEIPTNASRSQVDEALVAKVRSAVQAALPDAREGLRAAIVAALGRSDEPARLALEQLSGRLAVEVLRTRGAFKDSAFVRAFDPLLDWPLLIDAVGRQVGLRDMQRRSERGFVYGRRQAEPLAAEYAPLVPDVIWQRDRSVERAFAMRSYDLIAEDVQLGLERLRAHAVVAVPFELPPREATRWRTQGRADNGFEWQVGIDTGTDLPCRVRSFVGEHLIATLEAESISPFFRYDAAVRWPGVLLATRSLDRIRVDDPDRLKAAVESAVLRSLLVRLREKAQTHAPTRAVALRLLVAEAEPRDELCALPLWPLANGLFASTAELMRARDAHGHLFTLMRPLAVNERVPIEPVVLLTGDDLPLLRGALGDVELLDYAGYAAAPSATLDSTQAFFRDAGLASLSFECRDRLVVVTPSAGCRLVSFHRGLLLTDIELAETRGMVLAVDGERTLRRTSPDWAPISEEAWSRLLSWLCEQPSRIEGAITAPGVREALVERLVAAVATGTPAPRGVAAYESWPVFVLQIRSGWRSVSAAALAHHFQGRPIPALLPEASDEDGPTCVLASLAERVAIENLTGRPCVTPLSGKQAAAAALAPLSVEPAASDDVLAAVRDFVDAARHDLPAHAAIAPLVPPAAAAPPPGPALARPATRPLPSAPVKATGRTEPAQDAQPVSRIEPHDVLGPVRYLMEESRVQEARAKGEQQKRAADARAAELAVVAPLLMSQPAVPPDVTPDVPPPMIESAWSKLVGLFEKPLSEVPSGHPLRALAGRVTTNLYVANLELAFGSAGDPPIRFDKRKTTLVLNPEHDTIRVLLANGDVVPLVAAAFSEINRELHTVSDQEELRALGRLLLGAPRS